MKMTRAEINEIETKIQKRSMKLSWLSEKIDKIGKPLARLIKKKRRERDQINKIRNEKGEVATDTT